MAKKAAKKTSAPKTAKKTAKKTAMKTEAPTFVCATEKMDISSHLGKSLDEVKVSIATLVNWDPQATILANGEPVDLNYVVKPGDKIELVRQSGEKG